MIQPTILYQIIIFVCVSSLMAQSTTAADSAALCAMTNESTDICHCSIDKLKAELSEDDYALYKEVSMAYVAGLKQGVGRTEAWDAAVKGAAGKRGQSFIPTLNTTNKLGKMYRNAIKACKK